LQYAEKRKHIDLVLELRSAGRNAKCGGRKHLSPKGVAAAGGWHDTETLHTYCQQPNRETLLTVMSSAREVHEPGLARRETATITATAA